ncbi:MAG: lipopolysaccharide biosynthesis protein [Muribaculaceae bacterium]|nr:lipopolysaccharide biosynthesis protein [Muribaculaceae bacterium]
MATDSNKRIIKNTGFLYIRMLLIMLVSLYTSRIVLSALGIDDYGVYMVVGGVISIFGFLNSSMISSTQRYLNFELGRGGENKENIKLKNIFRTSFLIHLIIAIVILVAGETIGLWFVNSKLNIPYTSLHGANIIYQTALLSFLLTIVSVPFNAAIIAHEKMNYFAIISIIEAILKLAIAFFIVTFDKNRLALYGVFLLIVQLIVSTVYITAATYKFKECSLRLSYNKPLLKEMSSFAGWNMFGSIAWLIRNQGMGILLNIFFGPALNAAKGIADQVSAAVSNLNSNFQTALNPQITKNYAAQKEKEMEILAYRGIKFSSFLLFVMAFPIIMCSSQVLAIWLEKVPPYASLFIILILVDALSGNLFGTPLMTALSATGRIKNYQISVSTIIILILPAAYVALKLRMAPESIFYLNVIFNVLAGIARLAFCKQLIGFSLRLYIKTVLLPVISVSMMSLIIPLCVQNSFAHLHKGIYILIMGGMTLFTTSIAVWGVGLKRSEKDFIKEIVVSRLKRAT